MGSNQNEGEYHVFTDTPKTVVLNTVNVGNMNDLQQQQSMNTPGVISNTRTRPATYNSDSLTVHHNAAAEKCQQELTQMWLRLWSAL